ncbi:MAG: hypothetical protein HPY61_06085 [Methanotrichaceae archaeon]|nr:hypothetical protein [Methanotrichaceae archaeon]
MKSRSPQATILRAGPLATVIVALSLCFFFISAGAEPRPELDPSAALCSHIGPSTTANYSVYIGPQVSKASFSLQWKHAGSPMEIRMQSPSGRNVGPASPGYLADETSANFWATDPEEGYWTAAVVSGNLQRDVEDYCLSVKLENASSMELPSAQLNGLFSFRVDDGDGMDGSLVLAVGVRVFDRGIYALEAQLIDGQTGRKISLYNESHLNFGSKTIYLRLDRPNISCAYRLTDLVLRDEDGREIGRSSEERTLNALSSAQSGQERESGARLNGSYRDYGLDIDGDGFYDYLAVEVGLDVFRAANYSLQGFLTSANGTRLVWAMGGGWFRPGSHIIPLDFDGKFLWGSKADGPYYLQNLTLLEGDSYVEGLECEDGRMMAYSTGPYNCSQFVGPTRQDSSISGSGKGEVLLTIALEKSLPAFEGRYSLDIVDVVMPPISSNWTVEGSANGYTYRLPGVLMPEKPNDFSVTARGAKDLNVGVRREFAGAGVEVTRSWVSIRAGAGENGVATVKNDEISPGRYHFKIFGDAADNATEVWLELKVVKKLIIDGRFNLGLNLSGFPSGNCTVGARTENGYFKLDEVSLGSIQ